MPLENLIFDALFTSPQAKKDEAKRLDMARKVADANYSLYTPTPDDQGNAAPHPFGVSADDWKHLSSQDRIARDQAFQQQIHTKAVLAQIAEYGAQAEERKARAATAKQTGEAGAQIGPALADYFGNISPTVTDENRRSYYDTTSAEQPNMPATGPARMSPFAAIQHTLRTYPAAAQAPQFDNTLQAVQKLLGYGQAESAPIAPPITFELPGGMMGGGWPGTKERFTYPITARLEETEAAKARGRASTRPVIYDNPSEPPADDLLPKNHVWAWTGKVWAMKQITENPVTALTEEIRQRMSGSTNAPATAPGQRRFKIIGAE